MDDDERPRDALAPGSVDPLVELRFPRSSGGDVFDGDLVEVPSGLRGAEDAATGAVVPDENLRQFAEILRRDAVEPVDAFAVEERRVAVHDEIARGAVRTAEFDGDDGVRPRAHLVAGVKRDAVLRRGGRRFRRRRLARRRRLRARRRHSRLVRDARRDHHAVAKRHALVSHPIAVVEHPLRAVRERRHRHPLDEPRVAEDAGVGAR